MHDPLSLRSEEDQYCEQEADEGPWSSELEEDLVVPSRAGQFPERESSYDGCSEGDTEEDGDAFGHS